MGHNLSRRRLDEMERSRRLAELVPYLVPGWRLDPAQLRIVETDTVLGAYQRGQEFTLRCRRPDCSRRVALDLRAAIAAGFGDRPLAELIERLRCRHWSGCDLRETSASYPRGVPLVGYLGLPDMLVAIACIQCGQRLLLPPRAVIDRLKAARIGDGATGVRELGSVVRGPCRACRGMRFSSALVWPSWSGSRPI
ncbi:MAG: hypothetical protein JO048_17870 [Methylobacteriaceae bacterium]|nr:hypothetical protein [Methylobacteriaceae bacterium]